MQISKRTRLETLTGKVDIVTTYTGGPKEGGNDSEVKRRHSVKHVAHNRIEVLICTKDAS